MRLPITTLDTLLNETGELITCSVRSQQRAREAHTLAEIPPRWRRTWRLIRPILNQLQSHTQTFQPTVHHLSDRQTPNQIAETIVKTLDQETSAHQRANLSTQIATLIDALDQANTLLSDLEIHLSHHARNTTEDQTRLSVVTDRLHDQIRRTRMLPITTLFNPLRLQLREIARDAGKQIDLELDDGGAEADRQVLERLREVILHLLRNSVDHGIEPPATRLAHHKPATGHIALRATINGDYLTIAIEDDGAGLDTEAIKQRAATLGMLNENDLHRLSETELIDMIFLPGFSTRQTVSKMSGRGVGLDIVRSQIERMHGRVSVQSSAGAGCVFTLQVPLSLTSSHGLLIQMKQATYMLPLDSLQRIVAVTPADITVLEGRPCLIIDQRPLPLVHLSDLINPAQPYQMPSHQNGAGQSHNALIETRPTSSGNHMTLALLLGSGERQIACTIDAVLGEQELVVYRLPFPLQRVRYIAGATILADGSIIPILDVVDIVRTAIGTQYTITIAPQQSETTRSTTILVVDDSITTRTLEKNILEAAGYQVKLATDGAEALETLRHLHETTGCHLLLSDIDMPRVNGFELTTHIRADPVLKNIPIVLVTSLDTPADRERGINAGADAYIIKRAFDQQALLDTIEQLI